MLLFEDIIEQYEAAVAERGWHTVELGEFVPGVDATHYWSTLVELLRVRMEHQIAAGDLKGVERCLSEYPDLRTRTDELSLLAFEEFRLLNAAGVSVAPEEYAKQWQVDVSQWDLEGKEYHLTDEDWREASEREATSIKSISANDSVRPPSTRTVPRRRAVLESGQVFGPFRILVEIGSGALATVYLAEQLDLSERLVVLKVCSIATSEPQRIAQLQHPNIVQILSLHDVAGYQVICMPYVGATTFADILAMQSGKGTKSATSTRTSIQVSTTISLRQREVQTLIDGVALEVGRKPQIPQLNNAPWLDRWKKSPFEQVVTELLYQATCGLEHAHQNDLVHSDLKPANILLGDDGKARLVDFNVAQQAISGAHANTIGGTLPYMAPEHLQSLIKNVWNAGPASDIYSLGVVAYQLLTGKLPFETATGPLSYVVEQSLKQRQQVRPALSASHATSDLRSIIEKMLEPDLSRRYRSASDLCEDLKRHLEHRPLRWATNRSLSQRIRKWTLRHPKLSSASSVGGFAVVCVLALVMAFWSVNSRLQGRLASKQVAEFEAALPGVLENAASRWAFPELAEPLPDQVSALVRLLGTGNSTTDRPWQFVAMSERSRIAADLIKLKSVIEQEVTVSPQAHQLQIQKGSSDIGTRLSELAIQIDPDVNQSTVPSTQLDRLAAAVMSFGAGDTKTAIQSLQDSLAEDSKQPTAWLLLGYCNVKIGNLTLAEQAYASSLALAPDQWRVWFCRGSVKLESAKSSNRKEEFLEAAEYFSRALELKPDLGDALYNRAICREHLGDVKGALEDGLKIVGNDRIAIPANLFCARQYAKLGQNDQAEAAIKRAYGLTPAMANDFIELGVSRLTSDPKQALQDLLEAHRLRPGTILVIQNLAYLTMEVVPNAELAKRVLDDWAAIVPQSAVAIASRGVFHARQGDAKAAVDDAQLAQRLSPSSREIAQISSIYALIARATTEPQAAKQYRDQAFVLLATALQQDWKLVAEISRDPDLLTLQTDPRFNVMLGTAASLLQLPKFAKESKVTSELKSD